MTSREMILLAQTESARLLGCRQEDLAGSADLVITRENAQGKRGKAAPFCFLYLTAAVQWRRLILQHWKLYASISSAFPDRRIGWKSLPCIP